MNKFKQGDLVRLIPFNEIPERYLSGGDGNRNLYGISQSTYNRESKAEHVVFSVSNMPNEEATYLFDDSVFIYPECVLISANQYENEII